jgi:hypothetical protein
MILRYYKFRGEYHQCIYNCDILENMHEYIMENNLTLYIYIIYVLTVYNEIMKIQIIIFIFLL